MKTTLTIAEIDLLVLRDNIKNHFLDDWPKLIEPQKFKWSVWMYNVVDQFSAQRLKKVLKEKEKNVTRAAFDYILETKNQWRSRSK